MNQNLDPDVENWEVEANSGNFQHSAYCRNQCPIEDRIFDFDIMNSRNATEIRKKKHVNIRIFQKKPPFKKPLGMYTLGGVCILTNAKLIDNLIERDNEQQSALYHQRKRLIDGIPTACLSTACLSNERQTSENRPPPRKTRGNL